MDELASKLPQKCVDLLPNLSKFFDEFSEAKPVHYKGHILGAIFPVETVQLANEKWRPKDGDVIVATYKKTGTSWTREIVRLIMYMNDPDLERLTRAIPMLLIYVEAGPTCSLDIMDHLPVPRRVIVSHSATKILNLEEYLKKDIKVIYVLRNPKDQAVSLYNFFNSGDYASNPNYSGARGWNAFFENLIAGRLPTDCMEGEFYPFYILSWIPYMNHPKVLVIHYEQMKKHPVASVAKIANFMGCELSQGDVAKVVERTSFKSMKEAVNNDELADGELLRAINMYRKGEVGDWKNYFTVAQSEKMDEIFREKLKGTGITFEYE